MFCTNCGEKVEDGIKFCPSCGKNIIGSSIEPVLSTTQQPVTSQVHTTMADEFYCFSCGSVIKKAVVICPKCGVNQSMRDNTTAIDVYCTSCGKTIKKEASTCPFCGVNCTSSKSYAKDKKGQAIVSLVLGLVGAIAWLIPFLGFPVTILGLIMGIIGHKSTKKNMAIAGIILSIIGFIATIINSVVGATLAIL
jgi:uncharacterized membrane protein YvbJ